MYQEESEKYGESAGYQSAVAYGGAPKRDQLRAIQNANILGNRHSTVGRLLNCLTLLNALLERNQFRLRWILVSFVIHLNLFNFSEEIIIFFLTEIKISKSAFKIMSN